MRQPQHLYQEALRCLGEGEQLRALGLFERALAEGLQEPQRTLCSSYVGLLRALQRGQLRHGLQLCQEALGRLPHQGVLYLNLAKLKLRAGDRAGAIQAAREGMRHEPLEELQAFLQALGSRKPPVFPSLPRSHPLNKYVGLLLSRLGLR
jgi:tetratricopeptide (TPR) repeat protein